METATGIKNIFGILAFTFLLAIGMGCVERYEFTPKEPVQLLVADGSIHQGKGPYELKLTRTSAFGSAPIPVSGAQISIYDDLGKQELYQEINTGVYQVSGYEVTGQAGRTYYVEILTTEGNTYRSQPQTMPAVVRADSAYFETKIASSIDDNGNVIENRQIDVYVDTPIWQADHHVWLRWKTDVNYSVREQPCSSVVPPGICYVTEMPNTQNIVIFSSEGKQADHLHKFLVTTNGTNPIYAFYSRYYINIYQYAITREAYQYWQKLEKTANQGGSIFDAPPAAVQGNLYNVNNKDELVLGFFEATAVDTVRTFVRRGDLAPLPVPEFCGFGVNSQPRDRNACCNCLLLPNSSQERPAYWDE